ncbi:hypothetical protein IWQ62_001119 [Dispira parvispora]|uniref:Uncharacterized protein n=1 Tax=Dispira parvispora TaxID=1520584 RepID=A0A9W8AUD9_9FUNG|nr:hypothetical protein IWQ62_001119 [Dispira parvispora]
MVYCAFNSARGPIALSQLSRLRTTMLTSSRSQIPWTLWVSLRRGYTTDLSSKPLFDKILIANRGEIACRVMKTARRLGIQTVAIYSEADRYAQHVSMADEAFCVGPAPSAESYLNVDRILEVIHSTGSQAVHPGYGFLSENADFAKKLQSEGVTFIGPPASAIVAMGSKSESKYIMQKAQVPVVPGYHGENQDVEFLKAEAARIQYPVLIKAVKGGGGKGMRIVERPEDFEMMLESSRRESIKSFGDDKVLIEKYLQRPRHVEVQVFADKHGNAVHLYERDCSVQRRHQKVLEEAPAPHLTPDVREDLGSKAVAAALAVNYVGAGTVEFIMDYDTQKFYFMEMNTRLQVEHPVTEMVTQTDLVQWQLEVAAGNHLPMAQKDIPLVGHAFEARIYAENPARGFLPDTGSLVRLAPPTPSDTVRIDTGVVQGDQVSVHYDPMIAKLIVSGRDRTEALRVLRKALAEYQVVGLHTNIQFLRSVVSHPAFIAGDVETGFIPKFEQELLPTVPPTPSPQLVAQAGLALIMSRVQNQAHLSGQDPYSPWNDRHGQRLNHTMTETCELEHAPIGATSETGAAQHYTVRVEFLPSGRYTIEVEAPASPEDQSAKSITRFTDVNGTLDRSETTLPNFPAPSHTILGDTMVISTDINQSLCKSVNVFTGNRLTVLVGTHREDFIIPTPTYLQDGAAEAAGSVKTPMPCKISQILVQTDQVVEKNTPLVILEAMKMEHVIRAPFNGKVKEIYYQVGDMVQENKSLVELVAAEE